MIIKKIILTTVAFLTLAQLSLAQTTFDKKKLDHYFDTLEQNNKFMGSVSVSKDGEIIYSKSIGFADVESKIKATDKTKYRIGSISKSFTAVLVLKAVENNKLDLSTTINKWFPTISNGDKITVKQLLNHRSGIHNFTDDSDYLDWNTQPKTEKEMIEIISKGGSDFTPDSKAEYSNSNYALLTYIVEKSFSESFPNLIERYIVKPIGLKNTYVFGTIDTSLNEAKSYNYIGTWKPETETDYTIPLGAGALISTPTDLTKFADALFGGKLLKAANLKLMMTINDGYGLGLFKIPFYKSIGYGHTGGIDGFVSVYSHFPDEKISYALTSNGTNFKTNDISIAVLSAVFNKTYEIPTFTSYHITSSDLDKYLGVYASKQIALKIIVTKDGETLFAQGTNQPALPLEATDKDKFKFDQVGAKFEFNPDNKTMTLFQGGGQFEFTKQ